jgi:acetyl esterase
MRRLSKLGSVLTLFVVAGAGCALAPAPPSGAPLDPPTRAFIEKLAARGGPPLYERPVADARAFLVNLQAEYAPATKIPADVEDHVLPVGPSGAVPIRIVRPQGAVGPLPVVVYFHGGGWILGDETTHDRLIREIATRAQAAVVFVKYTPSPEAQFPVPIEEAFAATRDIAENGARFGLDPSRLAVAGDSVGGNMATVVALLAKQHGGPAIRYQVLAYPVTDAGLDTASYQRFAEGPWLTKKAMEWFFDAYAPKLDTRSLPYVSPLRASTADLQGLPPALVIVDENDVLRDEGEAYAHALMQAGVPVRAVRYLGTIHDFMMLNALADTPASESATALVGSTLRAALSR